MQNNPVAIFLTRQRKEPKPLSTEVMTKAERDKFVHSSAINLGKRRRAGGFALIDYEKKNLAEMELFTLLV